jgi:hypothetical protein
MDHPKDATLGSQVRGIGLIFLIISLILFPFVISGLYDYSLNEYWRSLPTTSLGSIPGSGTVKITGQINSSDKVALRAHYADSDTGSDWIWYCTDVFYITDGNTSVKVICTEYFEIKEPENYGFSYEKAPAYMKNDKVLIIGEVQRENGHKVIHLRYMSSEGTSIEHRTIGLVPALLVLPIFLGGIAWGRWVLHSRDRQHEKQVEGAVPKDISTEVALMGPSLKWISNAPGWSKKKIFSAIIALAVLNTLIIAMVLIFVNIHRNEIYISGLFLGVLPIFLVVMPIGFWYNRTIRPSKFAVSRKGIHFWYDDPENLLLEERYVGWDEIETLGEVSVGKEAAWMIIKKNGVKIWIGQMLDEKSIMYLHSKWNTIRRSERN